MCKLYEQAEPLLAAQTGGGPTYDLLIRNGRIVDGTGSPSYAGDVAVSGDTILM